MLTGIYKRLQGDIASSEVQFFWTTARKIGPTRYVTDSAAEDHVLSSFSPSLPAVMCTVYAYALAPMSVMQVLQNNS